MKPHLASASVLALALSSIGCSEESNPNSGSGGSGGSAGSSSAAFEHAGPGACEGSFLPLNAGFCEASSTTLGSCGSPPKCEPGRPIDTCCVGVGEPGRDASNPHLLRTTDTKEYSDPSGAPPNLGCFDPAGYPAKPSGSSGTATLTGLLKPFANGGCDESGLVGVVMEVYTVQRTGDPATDGALGTLVGSALTVDASMPIELEDVDNCSDDPRPNRVYTYPNVPMDTELVIKTYSSDSRWRPLYTYNIYVSSADPAYDAAEQTYTYDVRALASDDFNTIPTAAIGKTITPGNAAIGGEVHDCDNVRLRYARVDVTLPRTELVYFNDNEDDPLPDSDRKQIGTGSTALYSALDVTVGGDSALFRVAGTGLVPDGNGGSKLVSLGYFDARAYKDSVTSVTLRGLRPFQVP